MQQGALENVLILWLSGIIVVGKGKGSHDILSGPTGCGNDAWSITQGQQGAAAAAAAKNQSMSRPFFDSFPCGPEQQGSPTFGKAAVIASTVGSQMGEEAVLLVGTNHSFQEQTMQKHINEKGN